MKTESKIINNAVELIKREDQIYVYKTLSKSSIDLETMKQMTIAGDEWNGTELCANLIDMRKVFFADSEARAYGAKQYREHVAGMAILVESSTSSYFANAFLKFSKPKVPTKIFTKEIEAIAWLKMMMAKRKEI